MIAEIKKLVKRYNDFLALDNIDLNINEGEIFGLLGPNGAGKTTTINVITGITSFNSGTVRVFDMNLKDSENEIKKNIGIVPQDIAIYDDLTAYENICFFGKLYGLSGRLLKERVNEAIDFTGLSDKKNEFPKKYSGGMKRRLNIACAIVHHPKLIIMDEPTVGIDPQSRNHILQSVKKLNSMGSTIIYTSHYMEEVDEICTNIAIMEKGRIIAHGTSEELKNMITVEDRISFELSNVNYSLSECLKKTSGVKDLIIKDNKLTVISGKDCNNLSLIIDCILKQGIKILSINMEKPTLENVFLTLTGRTLRD
jgi:ABC-2 type transport system ATP-binding protein